MKGPKYFTFLGKMLQSWLGKVDLIKFDIEAWGPNLVYKDAIKKDPLFYNERIILSTAIEILKAAKNVIINPEKVETPFMLFNGTADIIVMLELKRLGLPMESRTILQKS